MASTLKSKTYYDRLGRVEQAQVLDNQQGKRVISGVVYDAFGRPALQTLPAAVNGSSFAFDGDFIQNGSGNDYSYQDFDLFADPVTNSNNTRENPAAVNSTSTLGNYYSNSNTAEPYVAASSYPYARSTVTQHGVVRAAAPGEDLRMGSGHEVMSATFLVLDELNHYIQFRDDFIGGANQTSLKYKAYKTVTIDQNGQVSLSFFDLQGNLVATALSGYKQSDGGSLQHTHITNSSGGGVEFVGGEVDPDLGFIDLYVPNYSDFQIQNGGSNEIEVWDMATDQRIYSGPASSFNHGGASPSRFIRILETDPAG
ncbi:MAG: hypothetical protein AAF804_19560 [Bacteroidota bacterium]